jgi:hypothetical protein
MLAHTWKDDRTGDEIIRRNDETAVSFLALALRQGGQGFFRHFSKHTDDFTQSVRHQSAEPKLLRQVIRFVGNASQVDAVCEAIQRAHDFDGMCGAAQAIPGIGPFLAAIFIGEAACLTSDFVYDENEDSYRIASHGESERLAQATYCSSFHRVRMWWVCRGWINTHTHPHCSLQLNLSDHRIQQGPLVNFF